jgi:hypothetical protein
MAIGTGLQAYSAYQQSQATQEAYDRQAEIAEMNADYAREQAADALSRGRRKADDYRERAEQLQGQQRAGFAAGNIDLSSGSALEIQANTEYLAREDAEIIKENAAREAKGYVAQARNAAARGELYEQRASNESPALAAGTTLLSGAGRAASVYAAG